MAYKHLSSEERFYIEQRLAEGERIPAIAKALSRHKTTLYGVVRLLPAMVFLVSKNIQV